MNGRAHMSEKERIEQRRLHTHLTGQIISGELKSMPEEDYEWYYATGRHTQAVDRAEEVLDRIMKGPDE